MGRAAGRALRLLLAGALLAAALGPGGAAGRRDRKDKDKKRAHKGGAGALAADERNLCEMRDPGAHLFCYCNSQDPGNATEATCWLFSGDKPADDPVWEYFDTQRALEHLKINVRPDGRLRALPARALKSLPRLLVLDVQYGSLGQLPPFALGNLSLLTEASLARNQIVSLAPKALARLPRLEQLNLDENRLQELGRDALDLPSLRRLFLVRNNLTVVQERAFARLPRLEELELGGNQLAALRRDTFAGLKSLRRLDLEQNQLQRLGDGPFSELAQLEELELGDNLLSQLSARSLSGLGRLRRLSLAGNRLRALPAGLLVPASSLRALDLHDNLLATLPVAVARPLLPALRDAAGHAALHLDGNTLACDCRLTWMYALRNDTGSEQVRNTLEELTCVLTAEPPPSQLPDPAAGFVRDAPADYEDDTGDDESTTLPASRRHLFDIPASQLPCPAELSAGGPGAPDAPRLAGSEEAHANTSRGGMTQATCILVAVVSSLVRIT